MTVVEFFDSCSVENVASALLCAPDKVILVGDNEKKMNKYKQIYSQLVRERGLDVEFEYRKAAKNNLMHNVEVITDIVLTEENCVFDLEGGEDLFLTAVGIVFDKYSDRMQLHRFNINTNSIIDCDDDGKVCSTSQLELTVEENIRIYGGSIAGFDGDKDTYNRDLKDGFIDDIELMWSICVKNPGRWNNQVACLSRLCSESWNENPLDFEASMELVTVVMKKSTEYINRFRALLTQLEGFGIIRKLLFNDNVVSFIFKDSRVRRCLTSAGCLLELIVAVNAIRSTDKKGIRLYNDVMTGVCIDWDGEIQSDFSPDVENEVDVILMKGLTPVFISCKNGSFNVDELYKLSVVAERFGGKYARKVFVASHAVDDNPRGRYFLARAKDMGIRVIDNFADISDSEIKRVFRALWQPI